MDTLDAIRQRRSVKQYDPDHRIPQEEIDQLLDLAIQSPTSFNMQNWRFVLVQDPKLRREIQIAAAGQAQVSEASLLFLLCADLKAWATEPQRYWCNAPQEIQDLLVPWMGTLYEGQGELQRDEAMRSVGIVSQTMMLAAKAMGYDSCPMIGFDAQQVAELIRLPEDHVIGMMLVVGKALQPAWPKPGQLPLEELLIHDRFEG